MNSKAALGFLAVLAAFIVLIGWAKKRATEIDTQSAALQRKVAELQSALDKARSQPEVDKRETLAQSEKLELMRLRNEVTQLRASNQALVKVKIRNTQLEEENQKLRGGLPNPPQQYAAESVPRDQWSFKGYGTPEATILSGFAAMRDGNVQAFLDSLAPAERAAFEQKNEGKSDAEIAARFQKEFGAVTGVRVLRQQQISPQEVVLDVYFDGLQGNKRFRLNLVGNEWKAGGPVNQSSDYDPLAFYRKNPELMKRYFPHLFREGAAEQEAASKEAMAQRYGIQPAAE